MLFITAEISKPKRLQGAFVSDKERKSIINYIKSKSGEFNYVEGITDRQRVHGIAGVGLDGISGEEDELLAEAKEVVINMDRASASLLQRRLSIGYARAARILDILEETGVVGPANGAKPREILISKEQYEGMLSQGVSGAALHNREETEEPDEYLEEDEDNDVETNGDASQDDEPKGDEKIDEDLPAPPTRLAAKRVGGSSDSSSEISTEGEVPPPNKTEGDEDKNQENEEEDEDEGRYFAR